MKTGRFLVPHHYFLLLILLVAVFSTPISAQINTHTIHYLSPIPGAVRVSRETNIIVRYVEYPTVGTDDFQVKGSISGVHAGRVILSDDNRTVIFKIDRDFEPGETVTVQVAGYFADNDGDNNGQVSYTFEILRAAAKVPQEKFSLADDIDKNQSFGNFSPDMTAVSGGVTTINGVSLPSDFPMPEVKLADNPDPGYIFLNTWVGVPYIMILDNSAQPVYYQKMRGRAYDFKVQPTGVLTHFDRNLGAFIAMDSTYAVVDTFRCQNGYVTDEHELQLLPNGHALLIAGETLFVDMSELVEGGNPEALVGGNHVQELDIAKNVVFEWRSWDHFNITDAKHENLKGAEIDYVHMNAIDVDSDGNILISSRNLDEITKINRTTGNIIWRLGGANNQFTFVNDPDQFSHQHSIRLLPNGNYILFDNGNYHSPPFSRAVEYQVDRESRTATLVWQFRNNPDYLTRWLGNVQHLPNGNTLINWAYPGLPKLTEVRPDGSKAFELDFTVPVSCYRTARFPWNGRAVVPYLVAESHSDRVTLIFNKFGDSHVKQYMIYGGESPNPTTRIDSTVNTFIDLPRLPNMTRYYFRVTAIDSSLQESDYSNEENVFVNRVNPDGNLIINGDFTNGCDFWKLTLCDEAVALGIPNGLGEYHLEIENGGPNPGSIQLVQDNVELKKDNQYLFEFDGYAANPRTVDAKIESIYEPWTNYGKIGSSYFPRVPTHFSYQFKMASRTDEAARVVFNCGISNDDIFISNISLKNITTGVDEDDVNNRPVRFELFGNYPNPFNPKTTIRYAVAVRSQVKISIYNILGEMVEELVHQTEAAGIHEIDFSAAALASGLYYCSMEVHSLSSVLLYNDVLKMSVIK